MDDDPLRMYLVIRRGAFGDLASAGELTGAAAVRCVRDRSRRPCPRNGVRCARVSGMTIADLQVEEHALADGYLIAARGDIDHDSAPLVADVLRRVTLEHEGRVLLDLTETGFIDSAGISTLLNGLRRLTRQRRTMVVVCPAGPPRRVFELLGLVGTFDLVMSLEEAG